MTYAYDHFPTSFVFFLILSFLPIFHPGASSPRSTLLVEIVPGAPQKQSLNFPCDTMSGFDAPTKAQLIESCNQVETVLEALHDHTNTSLTNRSRIFSLVKALFTSLQRLEVDESSTGGAFHTADARAKHNLVGVLTSCGVVARQLRKRINSNALRHEDGLGLELMSLTNEIEDFLKLRKKTASDTRHPKLGTSSDSTELVEDLLRKQKKHDSEVESLGMRNCYSTST